YQLIAVRAVQIDQGMPLPRCYKIFLALITMPIAKTLDHVMTDLVSTAAGCRTYGGYQMTRICPVDLGELANGRFYDRLYRSPPPCVYRGKGTRLRIADQYRNAVGGFYTREYTRQVGDDRVGTHLRIADVVSRAYNSNIIAVDLPCE